MECRNINLTDSSINRNYHAQLLFFYFLFLIPSTCVDGLCKSWPNYSVVWIRRPFFFIAKHASCSIVVERYVHWDICNFCLQELQEFLFVIRVIKILFSGWTINNMLATRQYQLFKQLGLAVFLSICPSRQSIFFAICFHSPYSHVLRSQQFIHEIYVQAGSFVAIILGGSHIRKKS